MGATDDAQLVGRADHIGRAAAASQTALAPYHVLGTQSESPYDDLARLAGDLCETPVALVTLFEQDRQWFKARVGFDGTETSLSEAICTHALDVTDVLVIPDLSRDPRTSGNPLVTGPPAIRFYAGAPLRTPDGTFLGTLCVIDMTARPAGLSDAQRRGLRTLADQVMALLELRRAVRERDQLIAESADENRRLTSSEAHWRGLFDGLREGFMIGQVIRDDAGRITDWRHLEVNRAFLDVVGISAANVIGRTLRELAPNVPQGWIDFTARAVDTGEPAVFHQVPGRTGRLYDGRTFPIGDEQFAVIFLDVTDRTLADRRNRALVAISDQLFGLDRVDDMTSAASRIVGETMGGIRAGYGRLDHERGMITVEPDWTAPGVASIAGAHRYADYGDLLNELLVGKPLVLRDVRTDPRTANDPAPMQALNVLAQIQMPVMERGRVAAVLFIHASEPRDWTAEDQTFLRDVADRLELAINRLELEAQRVVQTQELSHRVKNTLAMVQAIASQTLKPVTERGAVDMFEQRLTALASAHDVLLGSDWEAAPLMTVARSVLQTAGQDERIALSGPPIDLSPRAVLSVSLLIHELATNAVKYGALSVPTGRVSLNWTIGDRDGRPTLSLAWAERGGPPATVPTRRGFGSRLINMGLVGTGGVDLDYDTAGFSALMSAPVDDLTKT